MSYHTSNDEWVAAMVARPAANRWVDTTKSPWTQHHFLDISSASGSKDLKYLIVIDLIILSSY